MPYRILRPAMKSRRTRQGLDSLSSWIFDFSGPFVRLFLHGLGASFKGGANRRRKVAGPMSEDRQRTEAIPSFYTTEIPILRAANDADRPGLAALEAASFTQDRIAPRSWRRLLRRPSALVLVACLG